MFVKALMLLVALDAASTSDLACGRQAISPELARFNEITQRLAGRSAERIVGGTEATAHSWPWQVAMLSKSGLQICGGSIINNEWILTAAHCCAAYSVFPGSYKIRVGAHDLGNANEANAQTVTLSRLILHPGYTARPVAKNDFCLLKTFEPLVLTATVSPVCLANESDGVVGQKCWVTGWGTTAASRGSFADFMEYVHAVEQGFLPKMATRAVTDVLRQVDVVVSDQEKCGKAYPTYITSDMICAEAPGKDSCQGDSGGPFVCQDASGAYKLVGVVSWGRGCAQAGYPGVYARTSTALDWIASVIYA